MGLFDNLFKKKETPKKMNFVFKSPDHIRYENGRHVSGPHGGAGRAIKVEPKISGGEGYTVTLFNLDGNHPIWQNNVQMAPKQMKVVQQEGDKIVLRGFGYDAMGASFADYGLTINFKNGEVEKCILHMHDRSVDVEYLKADGQQTTTSIQNDDDGLGALQDFIQKWVSETPMNVKMIIAQKSDELNNVGCNYYDQDDYVNAIKYFSKALEVMPSNDDALKNLIVCYKAIGNFKKMQDAQNKLDYLRKMGI